jgi:hypothetical protein
MTEVDEILGRMLDKDAPTVRRALSVIDECIATVNANVELLKHEASRQQEVAQARAEREAAAKTEAERVRTARQKHVRDALSRRDAVRAQLNGKASK